MKDFAPRLRLLRQPQSLNERLKSRMRAATIEYGFYCQLVKAFFVVCECFFQPLHGRGRLSHGTVDRSNVGVRDIRVRRGEEAVDGGNRQIFPAREGKGMRLHH